MLDQDPSVAGGASVTLASHAVPHQQSEELRPGCQLNAFSERSLQGQTFRSDSRCLEHSLTRVQTGFRSNCGRKFQKQKVLSFLGSSTE